MQAGVTRKIAVALAERGMKWKDVAWIIDVKPPTVTARKQKHNWELSELIALSRALGVNFVIGEDK